MALIVVDCAKHAHAILEGGAAALPALRWERQLLEASAKYGAVPLLVFNLKRGVSAWPGSSLASGVTEVLNAAESRVVGALRSALDPAGEVAWAAIDLHAGVGAASGGEFSGEVAGQVASFVQAGVAASRGKNSAKSLPDWALAPGAAVFMNIPVGVGGCVQGRGRGQLMLSGLWCLTCARLKSMTAAASRVTAQHATLFSVQFRKSPLASAGHTQRRSPSWPCMLRTASIRVWSTHWSVPT